MTSCTTPNNLQKVDDIHLREVSYKEVKYQHQDQLLVKVKLEVLFS